MPMFAYEFQRQIIQNYISGKTIINLKKKLLLLLAVKFVLNTSQTFDSKEL